MVKNKSSPIAGIWPGSFLPYRDHFKNISVQSKNFDFPVISFFGRNLIKIVKNYDGARMKNCPESGGVEAKNPETGNGGVLISGGVTIFLAFPGSGGVPLIKYLRVYNSVPSPDRRVFGIFEIFLNQDILDHPLLKCDSGPSKCFSA